MSKKENQKSASKDKQPVPVDKIGTLKWSSSDEVNAASNTLANARGEPSPYSEVMGETKDMRAIFNGFKNALKLYNISIKDSDIPKVYTEDEFEKFFSEHIVAITRIKDSTLGVEQSLIRSNLVETKDILGDIRNIADKIQQIIDSGATIKEVNKVISVPVKSSNSQSKTLLKGFRSLGMFYMSQTNKKPLVDLLDSIKEDHLSKFFEECAEDGLDKQKLIQIITKYKK